MLTHKYKVQLVNRVVYSKILFSVDTENFKFSYKGPMNVVTTLDENQAKM